MLGFDLSDEIGKRFLRMKNVYIKYRCGKCKNK